MLSFIALVAVLIQVTSGQVIVVTNNDICNQEIKSGFCKALFIKYYFDKTSSSCKQFTYGGCGGNDNRFDTLEQCESKCAHLIPKSKTECELPVLIGPCRAAIQRYYYNQQTKQCEQFIYGGCNGNHNNFESHDDCVKTCI